MIHTISLDGEWQLAGFATEAEARAGGAPAHELAAVVPGDVHLDLLHAGLLPDPYHGDNALACQWVADQWWVLRRSFTLSEAGLRERCYLVFEGVDTYAEITLNGEVVAQTNNMHVPYRLDVTGIAKPGDNEVVVRFTPPLLPNQDRDATPYLSAFWTNYRTFDRKMQCSYGWDWSHRFLNIGLWRSVRFEAVDTARIDDVFVRVALLEPHRALLDIDVSTTAYGAFEGLRYEATIADPQGGEQARWEAAASPEDGTTLMVLDPQWWWPNGAGTQPLYTATVRLLQGDECLDERVIRFGMRTIDLFIAPDDVGSSFAVRVNGRKLFMKGVDWIPMDSFPAATTPERYQELLTLLRGANMNMLRVWGGGVYERPEFYELCTEMGLLVWHDFMFACAHYPEDHPDWLANVHEELRHQFRALRNHTSIAVWCGNNENGMNVNTAEYYAGKDLFEGFLRKLCATDASRPYRITTPYGGELPNGAEHGTTHWGAWMECTRQPEAERFWNKLKDWGGRFQAEIHLMGAPPVRSLRRFLSEADFADPLNSVWEHHCKDNPHSGCDMNMLERLDYFASVWYGAPNGRRSLADLRAFQHRDMVTWHAEEHRRNMFFCAGALYWMSHDCWPTISGALVDYYMAQKAGYFGAKRGFKPVLAAIDVWNDRVDVVICSDRPDAFMADVLVEGMDFDGTCHFAERISPVIAGDAATKVFSKRAAGFVDAPLVAVHVLEGDRALDRTVAFMGLPKDHDIPDTALHVESTREEDVVTLQISTESFAQVVTIEPETVDGPTAHDPVTMPAQWDAVDLSDCYFHLIPRVPREVTVRLRHPERTPALVVRAWNADAVRVPLG